MKGKKLLALVITALLLLVIPFAAYADEADGWHYNEIDGTWKFYRDGSYLTDTVQWLGDAYYGFDSDGVMYSNRVFRYEEYVDYYWETNYYYATANGQLYTGGWVYAMDEYENMSWYYFGADAKAYKDTVCWIGDAYYGFDYSGRMYNDTVFSNYVEIDEKWDTYTFYAQDGGKLFTGGWAYIEKWGSSDWYYFNANATAYEGILYYNGNYYGMNADGRMGENEPIYVEKYIENYGYDTTIYFCNADGTIYNVGGWKQYGDEWYYLNADGSAVDSTSIYYNGYYYAFNESGRMLHSGMQYTRIENKGWGYVWANEDGTLYTNFWHFDEEDQIWYYFGYNGITACNGSAWVNGSYYLFDSESRMVTYQQTMDNDCFYYAYDYSLNHSVAYMLYPDDTLVTGGWYYLEFDADYRNGWYYFRDNGAAYTSEVAWIGNAYYGFDGNGRMFEDTSFSFDRYNSETGKYEYSRYCAREDGTLLVNEWRYPSYNSYNEYFGEGGKAPHGPAWVGGQLYLFDNGELLKDGIFTIYLNDEEKLYAADKNGYPTELEKKDGWIQSGNDWYCILNGELCRDGFYHVGALYYFDYSGKMRADSRFEASVYNEEEDYYYYNYYYAYPSGVIAQNAWVQDEDGEWYFYDEEGKGVNGFYHLGNLYYFNDGYAYKNRVFTYDDAVYVADSNCIVTEANGWFLHPEYQRWMFAENGECCDYEVKFIGDKYWYFDSDGMLPEYEGVYEGYNYDEERYCYYIVNADGSVVSTPGWYKMNGNYYIVTNEIKLHTGFFYENGNTYYMTPSMSHSTLDTYYEADRYGNYNHYLYAATPSGMYWISNEGYYNTRYGYVYVKNDGTVATNEWIGSNGKWYYYGEEGYMYISGDYYIDGDYYYFDKSGAMVSGGWYQPYLNSWIYANEDGTLVTGLHDSGYMFDSTGYLVTDSLYYYNGDRYIVDSNGIAQIAYAGWNLVGEDWYYIDQDGDYVTGTRTIDGVKYCFDYSGVLQTNTRYDGYITDSNGAVLTGWLWYDGYWYYAHESGYTYNYGIEKINGKDYFFIDSKLQLNASAMYNDMYYTTNADGAVISATEPEGWVYSVDSYGIGDVYYYVDGERYTGWVGDYYVSDGVMYTDTVFEWQDNYYCLMPNGKYVRNAWYEYYEDEWVLAKPDGSLYYHEWYQDASGRWYYFNRYFMAIDGIYTIDGERHEFDENGVWLGAVYYPDTADGWKLENGNWRYYVANQPVKNRVIFDGTAWYAMYYNGNMITNAFYSSRYFGADGEKVDYKGWNVVKGNWVYFNEESEVCTGWINDGGSFYLVTGKYADNMPDETRETYKYLTYEMATGVKYYDSDLYYFGADGRLVSEVKTDGWYEVDGDWFYVSGGDLIRGEDNVFINGNYYAFYDSGVMVSNASYNGVYYLESGVKASAGWHWVEYEYEEGKYGWIYVLANGRRASGVHLIGGVEYAFKNYILAA